MNLEHDLCIIQKYLNVINILYNSCSFVNQLNIKIELNAK